MPDTHILNRALRLLLITNGLMLIAAATLGPIYALFVEDIGGDLLDASVAATLFALSAGLVTMVSGKFSDDIRHSEWVMISGYLLIGLGFFFYMFVDTVFFLFAVQILIGFGEAVYSPAFDKLYSTHLEKNHGGADWGIWESINYFSAAFGSLIGGLIVTRFGFHAIFLVMSFLSFSSALYLIIRKRILCPAEKN